MTEQLRGVNLGGWLVLEKWMTPSVFDDTDAVDEYTFMQTPGAIEKLRQHRQRFITEKDFKWLRDNGINAVRIPVGYWVLQDSGPYKKSVVYLDKAIRLAKKYDLQVLIDLHGPKGSQNGKDHSGRIGKSEWFRSKQYRQQTIEVLVQLAQRYADQSHVWGLELLNEPKWGLFHFKLRRFYKTAYKEIIKVARPGMRIVFHDAFTPRLMSGAVRGYIGYPVIMDVHWYQFASVWRKVRPLGRYFSIVKRFARRIDYLQYQQPVIIGEWSVVLSGDILNHRSKTDEDAAFKKHGELQLDAFSGSAGWFYWTYKTEGRGIWHFRSLVEDKIIVVSSTA